MKASHIFPILLIFCHVSCQNTKKLSTLVASEKAMTGAQFYKTVAGLTIEKRENIAVSEILQGNMPDFLRKMTRINVKNTRFCNA